MNASLSRAVAPHRPALRARPVVADRVHDRRERRRERRRSALPQVRRDVQPRAARDGRAPRRRGGHARPRRRAAATTCSAHSSAARDASAWSPTSPCGSRPIPSASSRCSPTSPPCARRPMRRRAIIAAGILPAALELMDQATIEAVESSIYAAGYPARCRRRAARSRWTVPPPGSTRTRRRSRRSAAAPERATCASRATRPSARDSGRAARRRSARWVASRRTSRCRTPWCRAPSSPDLLEEIGTIGERHGVRVCNVFHAGDGNLHPEHPVRRGRCRRGARACTRRCARS